MRPTQVTLPNPGPTALRRFLAGAAALYFILILMDVVEGGFAYRYIPGPIRFFGQVAALFPSAKTYDVDYRAEGRACSDGNYREMDLAPYFPILSGNKEGRFQRAMFFYHDSHRVLGALSEFLIAGRNTRDADGAIGGIRLTETLTRVPSPAEGAVRYAWKPLADFDAARRKVLYETAEEKFRRACGAAP